MVQVIEDSVAVVAHVRKQRAVPKATPSIVVGGSYGKSLGNPCRPSGIDVSRVVCARVRFLPAKVTGLVGQLF